jgi:hypothetical protein
MLLDDIEHLPAILRLCHDFEIFFERKQFAETIAENGVVVGYYDADLGPVLQSRSDGWPLYRGIVL